MKSIKLINLSFTIRKHCLQNRLPIFCRSFGFNGYKPPKESNYLILKNSIMSQRSITSFFSKTPKKSIEKDTSVEENESTPPEKILKSSPENNKFDQKPSKRQRLESSGSDSKSIEQTCDDSPAKEKKKVKRQRIISSSSESSVPSPTKNKKQKSPEKISPKNIVEKTTPKNKTIKDELNSPSKSNPKAKSKVKAEKESSPESKALDIVKLENDTSESKDKSITKNNDNQEIKKENDSSPENKSEIKKSESKVKSTKKKDTSPKTKAKSTVKSEITPKSKVIENGSSDKKFPLFEKNPKVDTNDSKNSAVVAEKDYDPSKSKYHPIKDACWKSGQEVPYLALAKTLALIEDTSGRLKIIDILANYLRSVILLTPEDLLPSIYMCLNQIAPAYHSLELGVAETYLMKAIGQCTGRTLSQMKSSTDKSGDLGLVAESARATQRTIGTPPMLRLRKVFQAFKEIANMTGHASVNKKIGKIQSLYVACRQSEARYLIRSLGGKLRVGLAEQSVLQALALAISLTPAHLKGEEREIDQRKRIGQDAFKTLLDKNALIIKTSYSECPNYDILIEQLLKSGVESLPEKCCLAPGIPTKPMLAHPARGLQDLFTRFEGVPFTCEWKYDGERAQIHVPAEGQPKVFSRNQEDNSIKYNDVIQKLPMVLGDKVQSCVLDGEVVAYDMEKKQILPFQVLSTRKRKQATETDVGGVGVCVYMFDLLYLNGRPLVKEPLQERRRLLKENFTYVEGIWEFARGEDCDSSESVQILLDQSVKGCCEGLMVKTLQGHKATYEIARRSHNWLKLKKDYLEGIGDTIDCVVLGAYLGRGKRAGLYGGFLLACYDANTEQYQSLCKIGTGFTDENLNKFTEELGKVKIEGPKSYYSFDSSHEPDVWFSPSVVWEVKCADLSLSPSHTAAMGLVEPDKGISLRFPRFVRVREDKSSEQATSSQQIAQLYLAQDLVKNQPNNKIADDEFY